MIAVPEPRSIKIRAPLGYRLAGFLPLLLLVPIYLIGTSGISVSFFGYWLWYWLWYGLVSFGLNSWFGVDLTPTEAVVNNVRRRRIAWSSVQCVAQEPYLGGRRVVLWTVEGHRVPLRAPLVDFTHLGARAFETRFHVIGQWWLAHRGPGRTTNPWTGTRET